MTVHIFIKILLVVWLTGGGLSTLVYADGLDGESEESDQLPTPLDSDPLMEDRAPLWDFIDKKLQKDLTHSVHALGLSRAVKYRKLAVVLVDITQIDHPRMAELNGDEMMYAASLPKIAILLAAFEKLDRENLALDAARKEQLLRMIRHSSNPDASAAMHWVGTEFINRVLVSSRYRLYDPLHNGGLWVGKSYGKEIAWRRDPINHLSHGATAIQVARFYYMLEAGRLVNKKMSAEMKEILANTAITHKFKLGLQKVRPNATVYRKSGTWKQFHADSALVERGKTRYIAVALADNMEGGQWLVKLIGAMDSLLD